METLVNEPEVVRYGLSLVTRVSVVLGVIWIVSALLRRQPAGVRHLLWSLGIAAVLFLPALATWMPSVEVRLPGVDYLSGAWLGASGETAGAQVEVLAASGDGRHPTSGDTPTPIAEPVSEGGSSPNLMATLLLLVWIGGVLVLLGLFLADLVRICRATRSAVSTRGIDLIARSVTAALGIEKPCRVLLAEVHAPVTWGLFRPVVLLPVDAAEWPAPKTRIVLMHELAHVRRLDYLPHVLSEMTCMLYWPNPLVWLARRRLTREQELACDDVVLRAGTASHDYAELLLDLARGVRRGRLLYGGVRMAERRGLKPRIRAILDPSTARGRISAFSLAVVVLAGLLPALSVAALTSVSGAEDAGPSGTAPVERIEDSDEEEAVDAVERGRDDDVGRLDIEDAPPAPSARPFTLTLEAERGRLTAPMDRFDDEHASGESFVMVPDQDGYDPPEGGPGRATFEVDIPAAGSRAVWARVIGKRHNDNSFFVSVDDGEEFRWDILTPERGKLVPSWTWLRIVNRSGRPLTLEPGRHTISFRNREDGSRLDAVFFTSDPALVPRGRSPLPPPDESIAVAFESEHLVSVEAPLEIRADEHASNRLYLAVADGFNSRRKPPADGRAVYRFDVAEDSRYVIWARVTAPDQGSDSFWVRANGGAWVRWNGISDGRNWSWQLVHDSDADDDPAVFSLSAGANTLEVAYREDGARIDRFTVTNNMYVHPSVRDGRTTDVTVTFRE